MENNILQEAQDWKTCISESKQNIEAIFSSFKLNNSKEGESLMRKNKIYLMDLRKKERQLKFSVEKVKTQLNNQREYTDSLVDQLKSYEFEKMGLTREIQAAKDLETKELNKLGIDTTGDREIVMKALKDEHAKRIKLSEELQSLKQILDSKQAKCKEIEDSIKKIPESLQLMQTSVTNFQLQCDAFTSKFHENLNSEIMEIEEGEKEESDTKMIIETLEEAKACENPA
ncbi:unnamed protein product [Blepharisma stoltei]|uniref:Uncharacterized protein n=1 Tax=Blepharisma stoltei TaxID=1481888 RepID=A0AAU9K2G5_9CILI|nr:unnamed protein product [Blepharisma stoltei]